MDISLVLDIFSFSMLFFVVCLLVRNHFILKYWDKKLDLIFGVNFELIDRQINKSSDVTTVDLDFGLSYYQLHFMFWVSLDGELEKLKVHIKEKLNSESSL